MILWNKINYTLIEIDENIILIGYRTIIVAFDFNTTCNDCIIWMLMQEYEFFILYKAIGINFQECIVIGYQMMKPNKLMLYELMRQMRLNHVLK